METQSSYWVPLSKTVDMALIDIGDDSQAMRQKINHWNLRIYRSLKFVLVPHVARVILPVNHSTFTAALPPNCLKWLFVGAINECGELVPWGKNVNLVPLSTVEDLTPAEEKCGCSCGCQDAACAAIRYETVHETNAHGPVIIKRFIKPDGSYIEEVREAVLDQTVTPAAVVMRKTVRQIGKLEVSNCGCVKPTEENLATAVACGCRSLARCKDHAYPVNDTYETHFNVIEEAGIIQLPNDFPYKKLYLEYNADLPCLGKEVFVPAIAAEAVASGGVWKYYDSKGPAYSSYADKKWEKHRLQKKVLSKLVFRPSVQDIRDALLILPSI